MPPHTYLPTYLLTYLPTHPPTRLTTHPPTYYREDEEKRAWLATRRGEPVHDSAHDSAHEAPGGGGATAAAGGADAAGDDAAFEAMGAALVEDRDTRTLTLPSNLEPDTNPDPNPNPDLNPDTNPNPNPNPNPNQVDDLEAAFEQMSAALVDDLQRALD